MAAPKFSREQVLKMVLEPEEEEGSQLDEESEEEDSKDVVEDSQGRLDVWINLFDGGVGCDNVFFKDNAKQAVLPIYRQSFEGVVGSDPSEKVAALRLRTSTLAVGTILDQESRLWLNAVQRRLGGRVSIRKPYYGEITGTSPMAFLPHYGKLSRIYS